MHPYANGPVYHLVTGRTTNGAVDHALKAGRAYFIPDDGFYLLRLAMFPGQSYFLKKNSGSQTHYTVYADYVREADGFRFRDPVGCARLMGNIKTHLEIRFPLLARPLYMDLFPIQAQ